MARELDCGSVEHAAGRRRSGRQPAHAGVSPSLYGRAPGCDMRNCASRALGQWQAQVDGRGTIGGAGLHGDWTDFHKHVNYRSYDLTGQLAAGPHVLGVELGNGMYNVQPTQYLGTERGVHLAAGKSRYTKFEGSYGAPKLIAELTLRYANGRTVTVGSDAAWLVAQGATTFSSIYGGEDYDARLGLKSWTAQDLGRGAWKHAAVVTGPGGALVKSPQPEIACRSCTCSGESDGSGRRQGCLRPWPELCGHCAPSRARQCRARAEADSGRAAECGWHGEPAQLRRADVVGLHAERPARMAKNGSRLSATTDSAMCRPSGSTPTR